MTEPENSLNRRPNPLQRSLQWIPLTPPMRWLLPRSLHLLDRAAYRLTNGRHTFTSLTAGVPVLLLTTLGAKSGMPRTVPLVGIPQGENIILIASNFGQAQAPGWFYNLRANPRAQVSLGKTSQAYLARLVTDPAEYAANWQKAASVYKGYNLYKTLAGREIPMFVLEPEQ